MMDTKYLFQKLTPVNNADLSVYEDAVDFIFENSDITNVAISGAYSAGKSSVLESYKAKHKKLRFVHISLAHFQTKDQQEDKVKESVLEGKILNQLIHQIPSERIPQTNFKVKRGVSKKGIVWWTILLSLLIGSIVFLSLNNKVISYVAGLPGNFVKSILSVFTNGYANIIAVLVCGGCSVCFLYKLIKTQKNKNIFHKISVQGNDIEIFEEQDDSYFDKYLNEVLYLFEKIEADVIVFEDMDRFNVNRIFERLGEVNTLTNINRKKADDYLPLRFFYLIRDDIFISKDRTKFFDYIIPIIPVLDSSNSYDKFLEYLQRANIVEKFDASFLQRLSLYVDDIRILKNVYNEFIVYIYRLNTTNLSWNKMMALIVYKNIFPKDFCDLQLAKGYVHEVFEKKPILIKESLDLLEEKRENMLQRIELAKKETLISVKELDDAYDAKIGRLPKNSYYSSAFTEDGEEQRKQYLIEKENRKRAIQDRLDDNIPILESELTLIEHEIIISKTKMLKELITRDNIDDVFLIEYTNAIGKINDFNEIKGSNYFDLLKFLIRDGNIDETYNDYMTYFYEDSLSANDKTFLRQITDKRGAEYTYTLKEAKNVLDSLIIRTVDFEEEETLNFDLLQCILLNEDVPKYKEYLSTLIQQLRKNKNIDFISKYYDSKQFVKLFIVRLNEKWPELFKFILHENIMPATQIRRYSLDTLNLSSNEIISLVNSENCLAKYISDCDDYLAIEGMDDNRIISSFILIGVAFNSINYERANKNLFHGVYKNSLYVISFNNIALMLRKEYGIQNEDDIVHKSYTMIQDNNQSPLEKYVLENMSQYISVVVANCNSEITDDENVAVHVLNTESLDMELKQQYINYLTTTISDINSVVDSQLWVLLLEQEMVSFSVGNFVNYYKNHGIDDALVSYVNREKGIIDFSTTEDDFGEEIAKQLFDSIAINNNIATGKYKKILIDLAYLFDDYNADEIADDKVRVLIREKILPMHSTSLKYIREKYEEHTMPFIKLNIEEYLNILTAGLFVLEETLQILEWDIADDKKIKLLGLTSESISVVNKNYSDDVMAYIISNNRDINDENQLYINYSKLGEKTKGKIIALAIDRVENIILNKIAIDDALLSSLLISNAVTQTRKIQLFTISIPLLNEETCKNHFDELGLPDLKGIFTIRNVNRKYEKSDEVAAIFEALKLNSWIYEYHEVEDSMDQYIVTKNGPKNKNKPQDF